MNMKTPSLVEKPT